VLIAVILVFLWFYNDGSTEDKARTLSFATLVIANIMLIVVNLSGSRSIIKTFNSKNKALWLVIGGALLSLVVILSVPLLQDVFHFTTVSLTDFLFAALVGVVCVSWFKLVDLVKMRKSS
jgi:Ca2+-transporting ATPase